MLLLLLLRPVISTSHCSPTSRILLHDSYSCTWFLASSALRPLLLYRQVITHSHLGSYPTSSAFTPLLLVLSEFLFPNPSLLLYLIPKIMFLSPDLHPIISLLTCCLNPTSFLPTSTCDLIEGPPMTELLTSSVYFILWMCKVLVFWPLSCVVENE